MKILATINFGKFAINQTWEFLDGDPQPFLLLNHLEDGSSLAIRLDERLVRNMGELKGAEKMYVGPLNIADIIHLKSI